MSRGWEDIGVTLPVNGWVAEDDEGPIAAVWLYSTDSIVSLLEWSVTRPKSSVNGIAGLALAIEEAKTFARAMGFKAMVQFLGNERLIRYYKENLGFEPKETATLMVCNLGG